MRLKVFACNTLNREIGALSAGCSNTLDIEFLDEERGQADNLGSLLQDCIDRTDYEGPGAYDAIVLAMGADHVCGVTSRWFPIVVPRVHDSAALLLGSAERYRDISETADGGLYWYTPGILERHMPDGVFGEELRRYSLPCGTENARCLLGMERDWARFGGSIAFVQMPGVPYPDFKERCEVSAAYLGWPLTVHEGDGALLRALLDGCWGNEFLTAAPTRSFELSYRRDVVRVAQ